MDNLIPFLRKENLTDNPALLIQMFTTITEKEAIQQILSELQTQFLQAVLIGASSNGNIINGTISGLNQTMLSFTRFERTTLTSALVADTGYSFKTGRLLGLEIVQNETQAIIAFSDGLHTCGEEFLFGLTEVAPHTVIAGGMAGDNGHLNNTFVFTLNQISEHGAVGVALNSTQLYVNTYYNFGWQPVGQPMTVTRANSNIVYEINGEPAQSMYERYFGSDLIGGQNPILSNDFLLIKFPLIKLEKGACIGRTVVRNLEEGALEFAGKIHEGDQVQFGIGSKEYILNETNHTLEELKNSPVESIFIYSCMARRNCLGQEIRCEMEPFKDRNNVAGFYTYGEFFYSKEHEKPSFLNQSMTLLSLSESCHSEFNLDIDTLAKPFQHASEKEKNYANSLISVSNFAVNISKDFEALNSKLEYEVKKKSQELIQSTLIDNLTKLPSRQSLLQDLQNCKNEVLIVININNFSKINGFYGLEAGDELLSKVARNLQKHLTQNEHALIRPRLYKLPSDEYAILTRVIDTDTLETSMKILNKAAFSHTYQILGFDILVQATWVFSKCDGSDKTLIQAELSGKEARLKKENFVHYCIEQFKDSHDKIQLAHEVRSAILENRLYPVFQPIFNNLTGELVKYECLARLKDSEGTVIPPLVFIEIAQMIQMYPIITEAMIHKSFRAFKGTGLNFSVNISLEDILSSSTQNMIFEAIQYYDIGNQVTFEILENQALEDDNAIFKFISKLKKLGAKIAIDDFGSGYANYQHLAKLQADYIKIDGSLIKNLGQDPVALSVVESMIVFAKKLNMKVIAEFVCSQVVYEHVKNEGIDYSQGFYLSEPLDQLLNLDQE